MKKSSTPLLTNYRPEVDESPNMDEKEAAFYQLSILIIRWMVEIGLLDIYMEVSVMSSFSEMPREGHFQQLLHMSAYLNIHHNNQIVFYPSYPEIDEDYFKKHDWVDLYGNYPEPVPYNAPMTLGSEFIMSAYVDA